MPETTQEADQEKAWDQADIHWTLLDTKPTSLTSLSLIVRRRRIRPTSAGHLPAPTSRLRDFTVNMGCQIREIDVRLEMNQELIFIEVRM